MGLSPLLSPAVPKAVMQSHTQAELNPCPNSHMDRDRAAPETRAGGCLIFGGGAHAEGTIHSLKGNPEGRSMKEKTQISAEGSQQVRAIGEDE